MKNSVASFELPVNGECEPIGSVVRSDAAEIVSTLYGLLADAFALYVKTKNFQWHMSEIHFRDYHLLLEEQADQISAMTDDIADRARKIGETAPRFTGDIARHQRLKDNDNESLPPEEMMLDLCVSNRQMTRFLCVSREVCETHQDPATASLIENWIGESERRTWFLFEIVSGI